MTGVVLRILDGLPAIATDRFWKGVEFALVLFSISEFTALAVDPAHLEIEQPRQICCGYCAGFV